MKIYPLEPAGENLLHRTQAHSVANHEFPVSAAHLFALLEEGPTWCMKRLERLAVRRLQD